MPIIIKMNREYYIELIYKSLSGEISIEEKSQLDNWLNATESNQKEMAVIEKMWSMSSNFTKDLDVDLDKDFAQLEQKINTERIEIKKEAIIRTMPMAQKRAWWKPLSVAAAVVFLAGAFFFLNQNNSAATQLAMETGANEIKEIQLADGSKVWLNENSKLTYDDKMDGVTRQVALSGEAFFEVAKNPNQPFVISTRDTEVKVLGTSFEVRAFDEETKTEVVVKTGKVSLGKKGSLKPLILTKNQRGSFDTTTNKYSRGEAKNMNSISWQNQVLDFDNIPLEKVLKDLESHFDIQLTLANSDLLNCTFGSIFNEPKQQETLEAICRVFDLKLVEINKKSFRLEGGRCTTTQE